MSKPADLELYDGASAPSVRAIRAIAHPDTMAHAFVCSRRGHRAYKMQATVICLRCGHNDVGGPDDKVPWHPFVFTALSLIGAFVAGVWVWGLA